MTNNIEEALKPDELQKLIAELDAKSWAAMRYKGRGRRREDHICYRAARALEKLAPIPLYDMNGLGEKE